jgi:stage IV sporulation protein A
MLLLKSVSARKEEYDRVHDALESARSTGYGIVMPTMEEMQLEEPQIVRQGGRYGVRLKASAPSIHMILANIETEVSPAIGGEKASEEVINFLLQGYDGDVSRIWESNIFGKPLNDIAGEGLSNKIRAMPVDAQNKLRTTIQRIINEGSGGIICILL